MSLFKRTKNQATPVTPAPISAEAKAARREADSAHDEANQALSAARVIASQLAIIRSKNHFADAIRHSMRGST